MIDVDAIEVANFRGIGNNHQVISDFGKINVFIGPNNSGKSTFLRLISSYFPFVIASHDARPKGEFDQLDLSRSTGQSPKVLLGLRSGRLIQKIIERNPRPTDPVWPNTVRNVIELIADDAGIVWWDFDLQSRRAPALRCDREGMVSNRQNAIIFEPFMSKATPYSGGGPDGWVNHSIEMINKFAPSFGSSTHLIPAIRKISDKNVEFTSGDLSGNGLINRLAEIQNPVLERRSEVELFRRINNFLRDVVGEIDAEIEIPSNKEYILVHMNGRTLPLSSLGTGIHEIIIIAAICTLIENSVICIEEPEIHLHPILQRKLIRYLSENTENTYFIATHSPQIIDSPDVVAFHVRLHGNDTEVSRSLLDADRYRVCFDLGYRPSDIVQSNFVVWVEGPSERVYINHWIEHLAPELKEGVHYSVFFYGGRLLSHISAGDDDVGEFVKLRSLNRKMALIMDSDRDRKTAKINATKRRIRDEFRRFGGLVWITNGREIENYITNDLMSDALKAVHPALFHSPYIAGQFGHAFYFYAFRRSRKEKALNKEKELYKNANKVKVAHKVAEAPANLGVLDLRKRLAELVEAIQQANER